jgi:flagellar assembly factor FliW
MPAVQTKYFGALPYVEESAFDFPQGLPAFEEEKVFVLIEAPEQAPLVFLQSMLRPSLCFVAFPILVVDKEYQLAIAPEDLEELGLDTGRQPELGAEVMMLALLTLHDQFPATANLMAPIVLNVKTRRGLQAIRRDARYSHEHRIVTSAGGENAAGNTC